MDLDDRKVRAYVVLPESGNAVYEMSVRRVGDDVEIVELTRCGG
jgi:hypothetical protein